MTEDPAGDGAVIISLLPPAPPIPTEVKSSFHIGELELYISFSRRFRNLKDNRRENTYYRMEKQTSGEDHHLGKWFSMRFLLSGNIFSCSAVNLSINCLLNTRNTELNNVRPNTNVVSNF